MLPARTEISHFLSVNIVTGEICLQESLDIILSGLILSCLPANRVAYLRDEQVYVKLQPPHVGIHYHRRNYDSVMILTRLQHLAAPGECIDVIIRQ